MNKCFPILILFLFLLQSCGEQSIVKNDVQVKSLAELYGDGKHVIRNLTFPLSDSALAFQTPLPGLGPIAGGIVKLVGDIFASSTNMGKVQMNYTQPIPEIPDVLKSVRLKRVFFYMKPQDQQGRFRDWSSRVLFGKGHVTFDFLNKMALRLKTIKIKNSSSHSSKLSVEDFNSEEMKDLTDIFSESNRFQVVDTEMANELILLSYSSSTKIIDNNQERYGRIHILETTNPVQVKHYFLDHPNMKNFFKRILIFENSVLIEVNKDPVIEEGFNSMLTELSEKLEELKVTFIDTCTPRSCLEFNTPDVNLVPIVSKGNALKFDAFIHAGKVPESFKLKGFVEFEVKLDIPKGI